MSNMVVNRDVVIVYVRVQHGGEQRCSNSSVYTWISWGGTQKGTKSSVFRCTQRGKTIMFLYMELT